jgi:hypothetical protein
MGFCGLGRKCLNGYEDHFHSRVVRGTHERQSCSTPTDTIRRYKSISATDDSDRPSHQIAFIKHAVWMIRTTNNEQRTTNNAAHGRTNRLNASAYSISCEAPSWCARSGIIFAMRSGSTWLLCAFNAWIFVSRVDEMSTK